MLGIRPGTGPAGASALEVRVAAPPVEGAANDELLATLARALGVPRKDLQLLRGAAGRTKTVRIEDMAPDDVLARLGAGPGTR